MSRRQNPRRTSLVAFLLLPLVFAGCVFSPDKTPPTPPPPIDSPQALIQALADAYQQRNYAKFASIISTDPQAEYLFVLEPDPSNPDPSWGPTEELRIHQRMFEPQNTPPGDPPVPTALWLTSVTITLSLQQDFVERDIYYESPSNPTGLSRTRWLAKEATYGTNVFFETQGETDYQVTGQASFVVIEDLGKNVGDPGKFLIYRWEDLGTSKPTVGPPA